MLTVKKRPSLICSVKRTLERGIATNTFPVFMQEISDFNLRALYDIYRKGNGILPLEIL